MRENYGGITMCSSKSDIGAKAAWKGFSSQTTYIAYRLMLLNDEYDFYPEKIEDLMIKKQDSIIELVQIKNLCSDLALSSFSPKEADSFFRRALASRKENEKFNLKIVSFGKIGEELQGLLNKDETHTNSIKNKLLDYKYTLGEINWIFLNLSIIQVNEKDLEKDIFQILEQRVETMASSQIAFDTLICYVSNLSRYSKCTSKEKWNDRINAFVKDIVAIKGLCSQYGRTIINLSDYKTGQSDADLALQYKMGANAHPQHIRNKLDIIRDEWLAEIHSYFKNNNNIVIVKGASGQGKSSLAYRYLINNFLENYFFVIEKVLDSQQAIDIVAALNVLSASKSGDIIVYMDVYPYDKEWLWIVEEINKRGIKLKLLLTIREEDFNRSDIDFNKTESKVIELNFNESEARKIFDKYNSPSFLNFEQAWERFGETGPFMEFMYLLNQADTLKNKLQSQISQIINNESQADERLNILQVICYIGKNSLKINLQRLLKELPCNQTRKMLLQFEKEYFIRISSDNQYIESLHAVRAEILYEILKQNSMMDEETILLHSLNSVNEFFQSMLVRYFFNHSNIENLINKIADIEFNSWTGYASVLSALLWLDTYRLYLNNKQVIEQGNKLLSGNFIMFTGDATGYIDFDSSEMINVFTKINPRVAEILRELINSLPQSKIDYYYTDIFVNSIKIRLNTLEILPTDNLSEVGFVLFWLAQRNIFIDGILCERLIDNLTGYSVDSILDLLVGIQVQNQKKLYELIVDYLIPVICHKYNIIRLNIDENHIQADFIQNVFTQSLEENSVGMNERVMFVVEALRRLFFNKELYQVKAIGTELMPDIQLPDTEKKIPSRNLPLVWVAQMNGWLIKIDDFEKRPDNWIDFNNIINKDRHNILNFSKLICEAISYFYRKEGNIDKFTAQEYKARCKEIAEISAQVYRTPKCVNDRYGLMVSKNKVQLPDILRETRRKDKEKDITSFMSNYATSFMKFFNQMETLIVLRYNRKETNETGRLSMINITLSVSELAKMQNKYAETFSSYITIINTNDEYERLLLLAAMWSYLYNNKVRKESSVLYNCKELIKQNRRKIKDFFDNIITHYTGGKIKIHNQKIYVSLDKTLVDDFCERLYIEFRKKFPQAEALSIESLFLEEFADEIILTIPVQGNVIIGGIKIELRNLIYCQVIEKFMLYRLPLDKNEIDSMNDEALDEDDMMYNALKIIGNLNALSLVNNHTTSVIKYIKSYSKDTLVQENVFSWCKEVAKLYCSVLDEIITSFKEIEIIIPLELHEFYLTILSALNDYKETSDDIVKVDDIEQINSALNTVTEAVTVLLDRCSFI